MQFRPFTHVPGTAFLVPGSEFIARVFPALVCLYKDGKEVSRKELTFGPLEQFTVVQDLEKGHIQLTGFSKNGFIRHRICEAKQYALQERLYLGSNKQLKWPDVGLRLDMKELLPLWFMLGQAIPLQKGTIFSGNSLASKILTGDLAHYRALFQAGFESGFVPHLTDIHHMGFDLPVVADTSISPLLLLSEVALQIRKLFFVEEGLQLLTDIPSEFHCGAFSLKTVKGHTLLLKWSKHLIHTIELQAACNDTLSLTLQKEIKTYRLRQNKRERGLLLHKNDSFSIEQGKRYLLDRFET